LVAPVLLLACAHARTPEQVAMMKGGNCAQLLLAADEARASQDGRLARSLAAACTPEGLLALVDKATPEEALLWCGRAAAAGQKGCERSRIGDWSARLRPHLTIGPPDESTTPDPLLGAALDALGNELNVSWDADDPDVIVGKLTVRVEHTESPTTASVEAAGKKERIPAIQHRFLAKAQAQVELGRSTRTLRAQEEARDNTWEAVPQKAIAARFTPSVPAEDELKKRAALAWLRALGRALDSNPPETVDAGDAKGCVAYGLSLNINSGDPGAAARGAGDPSKVAACEALLGEPAGAGIPVP
jgi:hypothetical protein